METVTDFTNYMPAVQEKSATAEMVISRQSQEVQMAMYVAKQFPRDQSAAFAKIAKACDRRLLAESAMYEYPRGTTKVTGPSIRLAEVLAQNWGNVDFGVIELEQKNGESKAMAYAWDLETNVRQTKIFVVKHERKADKTIKKLDDPRDIYELVANNGARRLRACILGVIPGDIVDAAIEMCKKTLVSGHTEPLIDRVRMAIAKFDKEYSVTLKMIEEYIGCKAEAFTEHDYIRLGNVIKALRDGMAKREDYFDLKPDGKTVVSKTADEFSKMEQGFAEEEKNNGAQQSELPL